MILMNSLRIILFLCSVAVGEKISFEKSFELLFDSTSNIHPTVNITNILRNEPKELSAIEMNKLYSLGLEYHQGSLKAIKPTNLDLSYKTDHFEFFYTLDGVDSVENVEYVHSMGEIFEHVWNFFIDTLKYDPPPGLDSQSEKLYNVYIERLPSYYFGVTYLSDSDPSDFSCESFIKMRNNYSGSQFNNITEDENIKVTAVHEFFHSIQFGYNCNEELWLMEATAVWSEDKLYNNINDLYRYLPLWFSNPQKSLNETSSHMYGSFIFFQYIDEHLGGENTVRKCWENSRLLADNQFDNSIEAVDNALKLENSSFNEAHARMRISNIIMTENLSLNYYSYSEASGYDKLINNQSENIIVFEKGEHKYLNANSLNPLSCSHYQIVTETPIKIEFETSNKFLKLITIIKLKDMDEWSILHNSEINIDPNLNIQWIKLLVPIGNDIGTDTNYSISIKDGEVEDFVFYPPFPNPSISGQIEFSLQIIKAQSFNFIIFDLLGRQILNEKVFSSGSEIKRLIWNSKNNIGRKVGDGIYFVRIEGSTSSTTHKIVLLKNNI